MFKPHYGICKCHSLERLIVVKAGYCHFGNEVYKKSKRNKLKEVRAKRKSDKFKINKRRPTGELTLYKQIWDERPHKSEVSGEHIPFFHIWCFSHILPKGLYPKYRLKKENIIIKTIKEHYDWGNRRHKLKDFPEWQPVFELYETLKQQYNQEYGRIRN
ncbi:MAG: hypothetical protein V4547_18340 [Bacteroidota bacterium]